MALNFSEGYYSSAGSRQFADVNYSAKSALDKVQSAIDFQKKRKQDRLDTHKELRSQLNEVSTVNMWDSDYEVLRAQYDYLTDPANLDNFASSEEGKLEFQQLAQSMNDMVKLKENEYQSTHGSPEDPIKAGTYEAALQRHLTPEENYYEDDGYVETLTPEELQNRYNSLNASDMQAGSMTVKDGKFVYLDAQGNEVSGIKQREKNPFDPGLEPADFSGFTHFRKRDDGKFDDKTEVTEFVKNSIEENEKHRTQALRHYAKEKGLEESVVMENPDQYIQSATDMWVNEALDAWNQSKPTSTASEGDKRAAREAAAEEEARQNLYDSVRVIDRPVPRDEFETILEGALPMPTTVQETVREVVIPINRIKGSMNVTLEDGEMGQFRPQEIRAVNGILQVSGAYSFDRIQEGKSVQGIESRTITLDPNNISHVGQIQQLEKLGLDELNGVSLNQIINDPESIGIEAQQWSPNDI